MRGLRKVAIVLSVLLACASCVTRKPPAPTAKSVYQAISIGSISAALVPADIAQDQKPPSILRLEPTGYWNPTLGQLQAAESCMTEALSSELRHVSQASQDSYAQLSRQIGSHKRQYLGVISGGQQWIIANGFVDAYASSLLTQWVEVDDGGCSHWWYSYNVQTQQCTIPECNGEA